MTEEWFTIDNIVESENTEELYCLAVDSPDHQFLIGEIAVPTHNTDEAKEVDELKGEAQMIIGSIARLGRAAGVHLVIATQRPDAKLIPGETRDNLGVRLGCGSLKPNASIMLFGDNSGQRTPAKPPGGIYLQIHGNGKRGQGFFADDDWLANYFKENKELLEKRLESNLEGTPDDKPKDTEKFDALAEWDSEMDDIFNAGDE